MKHKTRQYRKARRDQKKELRQYAEGVLREVPPTAVNPARLFRPARVTPKSENQRRYAEAIGRNDLVFGLGPAGSGKTWLSVAKAVEAYQAGDVRRVVFVRPHLGLGKTMGYQPGDLVAKMSHYVRPLFDALGEFLPKRDVERMLASDELEVASLEFIRGRSLRHSFVILDEAQNATFDEMKAFLTRLGEGSQYVITGDVSKGPRGLLEQSDLPPREQGALEYFADRFADLPGVAVITMGVVDCVRHPLVKLMLERGF